jgi:hypothetical protein
MVELYLNGESLDLFPSLEMMFYQRGQSYKCKLYWFPSLDNDNLSDYWNSLRKHNVYYDIQVCKVDMALIRDNISNQRSRV